MVLRAGLVAMGILTLAAASLSYGEIVGWRTVGVRDEGLPWILALAALAAVLVGAGALRLMSHLREAAARWPRGAQGLVALLLLAALLPPYVPAGPQVWLVLPFSLALFGFVLLARGLGTGGIELVAGAVARGGAWFQGKSDRVLVAGAAMILLAAAATLATFLFHRTPHVVDGVAYLFQVKIFRSGALSLPTPALPEFFNLDTMVSNGRWFAQYPPGHAAALLLGDLAGVAWLVDPLMGAASVVVLFLLGRELYDRWTARWAVLLFVLSPFVLLMSSEFYSHATALLLCLSFLLFYARFLKSVRPRHGIGAGVMLGLCGLTRPLTAVAIAVPVVLDVVLRLKRGELARTGHMPGLWWTVTVTAAFAGLQLAYNHLTAGHVLTFGYALAEGPGFGVAEFVPHERTLDRLRLLNDALFGWPVPGLVLVLVAFLAGPPSRWDYLLVGVFASFVLVHAPVAYRDAEFGPRYLYEATGALVLLSARGLQRAGEALRRFSHGLDALRGQELVRAAVVLSVVVGVATHWYPHFAAYGSPDWRWAVHDDAVRAVDAADLSGAIVFVEEPEEPFPRRWWNVAFLRNTVPLDASPVIFARDLGDRNRELMSLYPSRDPYLARGDSLVPLK